MAKNDDFDPELSVLVCPTCQEPGTLKWFWNKQTTGQLKCTNKDCKDKDVLIFPEACLLVDPETGEVET
jgi:uncharacterized protein YbaR (Trm112 family)